MMNFLLGAAVFSAGVVFGAALIRLGANVNFTAASYKENRK